MENIKFVRFFVSLSLSHTCLITIIKKKKYIKLAQKEVIPPYVPTFDGSDDLTCNFDPQFTREPAELTPDDT